MTVTDPSLALFHPLIARWFYERVGVPTAVQAAAWPKIAAGEHVLITAPTGSGKTLTAFLWALNGLIAGAVPTGGTRVLYISPLKALNNDIQRNLLAPLEELRAVFAEAGEPFPEIRVFTRSGDTPGRERQRMQRKPPEILITTPESLNILLSSRGGQAMLGGLHAVILDEIHAVVDGKRGTHLITGVERLVRLSGEFQRIALSATVRPLDEVARFVGGYQRLEGDRYLPRPVTPVSVPTPKIYDVSVRMPSDDRAPGEGIWPAIVRACAERLDHNRSTLIFTNTRRLAETITWKLNAEAGEMLAYAHHGALSREIRAEVESRLKAGRLKAIVATNSLEMGIDIGSLDEVVLIQAPPGIAAAIQRVGRAGHRVGETSRGRFLCTHPQDLLAAAVLAGQVPQGNIEATRTLRGPLDVLAQVLISMTGLESWDIDDLYAEVRRSYPYQALSRRQFDLVLDMLAGRYADTRIRELKARLSVDRLDNTVIATPGALQELYMSGGVIPDRGLYHLRHAESHALIGELDEEYVWEATLGQALTFGTQNWRIDRITHNDVFVVPAGGSERQAPFWKSEAQYRDFHFAEQIALFLEEADARLDDADYPADLQRNHFIDAASADELIDYLHRQREAGPLPHRHHLLVEHIAAGPDGFPGQQIVLHTGWGGRINAPFALALGAAWEERFGGVLEMSVMDDAIYLLMAEDFDGAELLSLVTSAHLDELLRRKLEGSGFFGARFRECAGRALLLGRRKARERLPLWVSRLRSKRLMDAVLQFPDFPILLETWRTCLQDEFDMDNLRRLLGELESGAIAWTEVHRLVPSPFAQTASWRQINTYMYADDTPAGRTQSQLHHDLLQEVVFTPGLRPSLDPALVARFVAKRQRLAPGYAPTTARDLLDWLKERLLVPLPEWEALLAAVVRDGGPEAVELEQALHGKLTRRHPAGAAHPLVIAVEMLPRVEQLWSPPLHSWGGGRGVGSSADTADEIATDLLAEWLRYYGPLAAATISGMLGLDEERLLPLLEDLLDTQKLIQGALMTGGPADDVCDSENFEILLRLARAEAVPGIAPRPLTELPLFLAAHQGLAAPGDDADALWTRLAQLAGFPAPAEQWETVILPARLHGYQTAWLDGLLQEGQLRWMGVGARKIAFGVEEELDLLRAPKSPADTLADLLPDPQARYSLQALAARAPAGMGGLVERLWHGVWTGAVSNDGMAALRKGITSNFAPPTLSGADDGRRRAPRGGFNRWISAAPFAGSWYRLPAVAPAEDLLEEEERARDRARLLLDRYGLLCRELLHAELPACSWPAVFRALRLMELAGEVLTGCFFDGIPGLQFISHTAFRRLQRDLPGAAIWWVNACDPASPCGLALDGLRGQFPKRLPGSYCVFRGSDLVATVQRHGKELTFRLDAGDPTLAACFAPLHTLLARQFQPLLQIAVETINGDDPRHSPYLPPLRQAFDVVTNYNRVILSRKR